jgi:hypothetical protein
VLFGAASRLRDEIGAPLSADDRSWYLEYEDDARRELGDDVEALARDDGRMMSLDDAIARAREVVAPHVGSRPR